MRGRKLHFHGVRFPYNTIEAIKKESPNEGTETSFYLPFLRPHLSIKKESPNEGTETSPKCGRMVSSPSIKKESPNEGTETFPKVPTAVVVNCEIKKESPNEGTETLIIVNDKVTTDHT